MPLIALTSLFATAAPVAQSAEWISPSFLLSLATVLVSTGVVWGVLSSKVKAVATEQEALKAVVGPLQLVPTKHDALAADLRPAVQALQEQYRQASEQRAMQATQLAEISRDIGAISKDLTDKASKESVSALKEDLGEIKGMLNSLIIDRAQQKARARR